MKKKLLPILLLVALLFTRSEVWAANTHSADFEFDSTQYLSAVDSAVLSITGDVTIEAWAYLESITTVDGEHPTIISKGDLTGGTNMGMYRLQYCPVTSCGVGKWRAGVRQVNNDRTTSYDHVPSLNTWYHLAFSRDIDTGQMLLYLDGTQVMDEGTGQTEDTTVDNNIALGIGGMGTATKNWDGLIDEVRIWNIIRTPTEIADYKNQELVGNETGLVAYYKLNDSLLDQTANDQDLTNNNSVTFVTTVPFIDADETAARIDDYYSAAEALMLID